MTIASTLRAIHEIRPCTSTQLCTYMGEDKYLVNAMIDVLYFHGVIVWDERAVSLSPLLKRKWKNKLGGEFRGNT